MFNIDEKIKELEKNTYIASFLRNNKIDYAYMKNHLSAFLDCETSLKLCENCKGLFNCRQSKVGEMLTLKYDGEVYNEVTYCPYYLAKLKKDKHLKSFVRSDIPEEYYGLNLKNIDILDDNIRKLSIKCISILNKTNKKGLYIYGDLGVGKTYMCIALANSLVLNGDKVAFLKTNFFVNEMRKLIASNSEEYENIINDIKKVDYLFLDDIGSESVSAYSRDDLLFNILDYRMEHKLTTIFTSNLSKDSLLKHYTYDKNDNSSLIRAKRLHERIDILSEDFVLEGTNKRRISK